MIIVIEMIEIIMNLMMEHETLANIGTSATN